MNYRHIYHAGNICDVAKHASFALLLERMKAKETAFAVLDTHAGCGLYDLSDPRALKTGEAQEGIGKLLSLAVPVIASHPKDGAAIQSQTEPPLISGDSGSLQGRALRDDGSLLPYLSVLSGLNADGDLRFYPGSPLIASRLMRPQDRLIACELHSEDEPELRRALRGDKRAHVHRRDGYEAVKAFLPFPEKRGLVLIDPPFEEEGEFDRLVLAAKAAQGKMPGAVLALWYPIKERPAIWRFHEALIEAGLPKTLVAEFIFREETRHDRLNGSGLVILNAPWRFEEELRSLFSGLHEVLQTETKTSDIRPLTSDL